MLASYAPVFRSLAIRKDMRRKDYCWERPLDGFPVFGTNDRQIFEYLPSRKLAALKRETEAAPEQGAWEAGQREKVHVVEPACALWQNSIYARNDPCVSLG